MMGGALGLAVLASLAGVADDDTARTAQQRPCSRWWPSPRAFLVGAIFAAAAAAIGAALLRPGAVPAEHGEASAADEPVAEAA